MLTININSEYSSQQNTPNEEVRDGEPVEWAEKAGSGVEAVGTSSSYFIICSLLINH